MMQQEEAPAVLPTPQGWLRKLRFRVLQHGTTSVKALWRRLRRRIPGFRGWARLWWVVAIGTAIKGMWQTIDALGNIDWIIEHSGIIMDAWAWFVPWLWWFWNSPLSTLAGLAIGFGALLFTRAPGEAIDRDKGPETRPPPRPEVIHDSVLWIEGGGQVAGPFCPEHRVELLYTRRGGPNPSDARPVRNEDATINDNNSYIHALYCPPCEKPYFLNAAGERKRVSSSRLEAEARIKAGHTVALSM